MRDVEEGRWFTIDLSSSLGLDDEHPVRRNGATGEDCLGALRNVAVGRASEDEFLFGAFGGCPEIKGALGAAVGLSGCTTEIACVKGVKLGFLGGV